MSFVFLLFISNLDFSWKSICFLILLLLGNDFALNYFYSGELILFYDGFHWQYLAYISSFCSYFYLGKRFGLFVFYCLFFNIMFFLLSNFGVWFSGLIYEKSFVGLYLCYLNALPFLFKNIGFSVFYYSVFNLYLFFKNFICLKKVKRG
jgi:hypothetical protein